MQATSGLPGTDETVQPQQERADVGLAGILKNGGMIHGSREAAGDSLPGTWQDPQIHLLIAASGRSASPYYDITNFVARETIQEDNNCRNAGVKKIVVKSGVKAKLDSTTLLQWTIANLAIM